MTSDLDFTFFSSQAGRYFDFFIFFLTAVLAPGISKILEWRLAYVPSHCENFQHTPFRQCAQCAFALLLRMLFCFLNLTVPCTAVLASVRVGHVWGSLDCLPSQCTAKFAVSDDHQPTPCSNVGPWSIPRRFLCCGWLLAVWHFLLPSLQFIFFSFLG